MSEKCFEECVGGVWRVSEECLKNVWEVSEQRLGCVLGGVWEVSGKCLKSVWGAFGECLKSVWEVSEECLGAVWGMLVNDLMPHCTSGDLEVNTFEASRTKSVTRPRTCDSECGTKSFTAP